MYDQSETFRKKYIYSHLYLGHLPPPHPLLGQVQTRNSVDFVYIWPARFLKLQTFMGECKHIVVIRLIAISSPQSVQTDASKDDEIVRYKSPDFTPQEAKIVHSCRL